MKLNFVITNGKEMLAVRYISNLTKVSPLSLYFTTTEKQRVHNRFLVNSASEDAVLIASECLNDYAECWEAVAINHALIVDRNYQTRVCSIQF